MNGLLRLDSAARYAQDISDDDVRDAAYLPPSGGAWLVRRCSMTIRRRPMRNEMVALSTRCTGVGARWAEREVVIGEHDIVVSTIWVNIDPQTMAPTPLPPQFHEVFASAANGRSVSARLRHPRPPAEVVVHRWTLRRTDLDVFGHVNNAAVWEVVEQFVHPATDAIEIEFRAPIDGDVDVLVGRNALWLVADRDDVRASVQFDASE
jgi:acyl-ACP thioesterase